MQKWMTTHKQALPLVAAAIIGDLIEQELSKECAPLGVDLHLISRLTSVCINVKEIICSIMHPYTVSQSQSGLLTTPSIETFTIDRGRMVSKKLSRRDCEQSYHEPSSMIG